MAAGAGAWFLAPAQDAQAFNTEIFEITGAGKMAHFESQPQPGKTAFVSSVKAAGVAACIKGTDVTCLPFLETDAGGKAYILLESLTRWHVNTSPSPTGATALEGHVDGAGNFVFAGKHAKSGSNVLITGKVKFQKGTFTPVSLKGKIAVVSTLTKHFGAASFKSVGSALPKR